MLPTTFCLKVTLAKPFVSVTKKNYIYVFQIYSHTLPYEYLDEALLCKFHTIIILHTCLGKDVTISLYRSDVGKQWV